MNRRPSYLRSLPLAALVGGASTLVASQVSAQEATGSLTGRVTDQATGQPLAGITVVVQGPQGEDGALTDAQGTYLFTALPIGTYTVHFYAASSTAQVDSPPTDVSAQQTTRLNVVIPSRAPTEVKETYVIQKKAAAIDVGSSRQGTTWDETAIKNAPLSGTTFDDLIEKAAGAFRDPSGSVSIGGATGLENQYVLDGINVTGLEYGELGSRLSSTFVRELQINTAGYSAEFGGAMGGTINVITKSGSNDLHGSANLSWSPYWLSKTPHLIGRTTDNVVGQPKPDYDTEVAGEAGGAIIRDRLFWWIGFSAREEKDHTFRIVRAGQLDMDGNQIVDGNGTPVYKEVQRDRINFPKHFFQVGGKLDFVPQPGHRITLSLMYAPSEQRDLHNIAGQNPLIADPRWSVGQYSKDSLDSSLRYNGTLLDRHLEIDALVGLHQEHSNTRSPYDDVNALNQVWTQNAGIYDVEHNPACAPVASATGTFSPCGGPLGGYYSGGFGEIKEWTGNRWQMALKGAHRVVAGAVRNEAKVGSQFDYTTFDQDRHYSGPDDDNHNLLIHDAQSGAVQKWTFFTLPSGTYPYQFSDPNNPLAAAALAGPPYYQSHLPANVSGSNLALFAQDKVTLFDKVTLNAGLRYERQALSDFKGEQFLVLNNFAPRVGIVYDPEGDGRTKFSAHYGQFYEMIPMNLAARYFGGEGILLQTFDGSTCTKPPSQWTGAGGETAGCTLAGANQQNNGSDYPVQPKLKGQFNHEVALGIEREILEDLVVGVDYTGRWLGRLIEDGTTAGTFVLFNPGEINDSVLARAKDEATAKHAAADAATGDAKTRLDAEAQALDARTAELEGLRKGPKPERTYNALTFHVDKRFAKFFAVRGSYTYSRLIGNYNGLFDADTNYFAPNGSNFYDTPDLWPNKRGPLANDRPHSGRIDGYTTLPISPVDDLTFGLSFAARSGAPRNYQAGLFPGGGANDVFLLPRGSAGRTPAYWQIDAKIAYRRNLQLLKVEAFIDFLNIFNQQVALQEDDNYTFDAAAAIVNGTKEDLKYAKNASGQPITKNPNFGNALSYQAPFHARLGLRVLF